MDIACRRRLRIAIIVTRDLSENNGRTPILAHIIRTLSARHDVTVLHLPTIAEQGTAWDAIGALLCWIRSILQGRPLPLQCLLYAAPRAGRTIADHIKDNSCDTVYLDTVRCQTLLRLLRRTIPGLHIVTDFDDLMSRRARYLFQKRLSFSSGHVGRHFPGWLRFLADALLGRPIAFYEAITLPAAEDEVVAASDATILISGADRDMLKARMPSGVLYDVPPAVAAIRPPLANVTPRRFVFIGSDSHIQNLTAIDFLLRIWRDHRPSLTLHIYGRQSRPQIEAPGVHWHGFVENLAEVYQHGSVALVPALDRGGIKTKVLEAWAWGCPVLGNAAAFEGLPIEDYPLILPEKNWPAIIMSPQNHAEGWRQAACIGHAFVRDSLSAQRFERAWERLVDPNAPKSLPLAKVAAMARVTPVNVDDTAPAPSFARTA